MTEFSPLTVCYFGAYRPNYPRNLFYRQALSKLGVNIVECRTLTKFSTLRRIIHLLRQFWCGSHRAHVLIVAEFNHTLVPLAWILTRLHGMGLVFDPGVSFYDWYIFLTKEIKPFSPRGIYLRLMETLAYRLPDMVVWFTPLDEEYFRQMFHIPAERSDWLPPGIDTSVFYWTPFPQAESPLIVHWDGNMAPSHGVDIILHAAQLLIGEADIQFELFGDGLVYASLRQLAIELDLNNLRFFGFVSPDELRASVQRAHICLGVFRQDDKLRRSLYTKEMQALMAGRPLITGYGEAKNRLFRNGQDLIMISPEDPQALAKAILDLRVNSQLRVSLAQNGFQAVSALCNPQIAGSKLFHILKKLTD